VATPKKDGVVDVGAFDAQPIAEISNGKSTKYLTSAA
jgi:hypothetical protein